MKRLLTPDEIEDILDIIRPEPTVPLDAAMTVVNTNKSSLRRQLEQQRIYPKIFPILKKQIQQSYLDSLIQAGESVGIVCAQSIGEKQTQTTLDTFHRAGQSETTMTVGVPRFRELIDATKRPKNVNHRIYLKERQDTIEALRETISNSIVGLSLKDISTSITIEMNKKEEPWYDAYSILYEKSRRSTECSHCISFKLNMDKVFEYKLYMSDLADKIHSIDDELYCVFSPPEQGQFDVFVDCSEISLPEERVLFINESNANEIYLEECVQPRLENFNLCGVSGITEVFYTCENSEWIAETNGINSREINTNFINYKCLLAHPIIDEHRTVSNNVWDIYEVLGIEAARQFLIEEFMRILDGINACHPHLLVDRITHHGSISSISRYTMKKDNSGPFGKASFEETMDNFLNAGAFGETEPSKGVSASIICGKRALIGTGMVGLRIDLERLPEGECLSFVPKEEELVSEPPPPAEKLKLVPKMVEF